MSKYGNEKRVTKFSYLHIGMEVRQSGDFGLHHQQFNLPVQREISSSAGVVEVGLACAHRSPSFDPQRDKKLRAVDESSPLTFNPPDVTSFTASLRSGCGRGHCLDEGQSDGSAHARYVIPPRPGSQ